MSEHTPTPWHVGDDIEQRIMIFDQHGIRVADCHSFRTRIEKSYANAAHIVRCVNSWDSIEALRARIQELESK